MADSKYNFNGSLWVELNSEPVLGPGRVELLERIEQTGSIRQAAQQMGMSYAQAWKMIDHINTHFGEPIVISHRGGKGGGHAELTAKGKHLSLAFKAFHQQFREYLQEQSKLLDL